MNSSGAMHSFPRFVSTPPGFRLLHPHTITVCKDGSKPAAADQKRTNTKKKKQQQQQPEVTKTAIETEAETRVAVESGAVSASVMKKLDEVNPVGLGRRSRLIFDEVWRKFSGLGQISGTTLSTDDMMIREGGPLCDFVIPGAQNTTVLVVGATSRVGRIVVRKLMLRGYTVKALVRQATAEVIDMLPTSVEIVIADVGDFSTLKPAVEGCNKIIYCATARSSITGDLNRVDSLGVANVAKAFQDYNNQLAQLRAGKSSKSKLVIAKFKSADSLSTIEYTTVLSDGICCHP